MQHKFYALLFLITFISCNSNNISFEGTKNFNLDDALQVANNQDKSVLLYFSSYACVNCRTIENFILNDVAIKEMIINNYVLTTLVVDDHSMAEKIYHKNNLFNNKVAKKVGEINMNWQLELTKTGSQPYFVILSQEKTVVSKIGYTNNRNELLAFLKR